MLTLDSRILAGAALVLLLGGCHFTGRGVYETAPADATWVYYPESNVYYSSNHHVYYYDAGGSWTYSRTQPTHVTTLGPQVSVTYVGARPYEHHHIHRTHRNVHVHRRDRDDHRHSHFDRDGRGRDGDRDGRGRDGDRDGDRDGRDRDGRGRDGDRDGRDRDGRDGRRRD